MYVEIFSFILNFRIEHNIEIILTLFIKKSVIHRKNVTERELWNFLGKSLSEETSINTKNSNKVKGP